MVSENIYFLRAVHSYLFLHFVDAWLVDLRAREAGFDNTDVAGGETQVLLLSKLIRIDLRVDIFMRSLRHCVNMCEILFPGVLGPLP